ncbi:LLM class flavin-dependent oxidoreductase, partial [Mycobacterium sp. CBMA361]|nr:LLM class flavin-dependent oxidoreductase [Mycolicibacterium sp. CBMA 361]
IVDGGMARSVVGAPDEAADQIRELAAHFGVDEVMVSPVAAARRGCDPATAPARETTLRLLAEQLL